MFMKLQTGGVIDMNEQLINSHGQLIGEVYDVEQWINEIQE